MKVIGNIIWIICGGLLSAIGYVLVGILLCITIIGIPFGKQCFKFAGLVIAPFGQNISLNFGAHPIANIIWIIFFGWEFFCYAIVVGTIFCITIIGIPFGKQWFKLALLGFMPFGATY